MGRGWECFGDLFRGGGGGERGGRWVYVCVWGGRGVPGGLGIDCLLVACLTSQQHASVSQGRICSDNFRAATLR